MRIFKKLPLKDRILIFLKLRKPPKFKIGQYVRDASLNYYCQCGIITSIKSDIIYSHWGYVYGMNWEYEDDFMFSNDLDIGYWKTRGVYETNIQLIEPPFKEYKYDPNQTGDREDDI